ncbi:hypothetical protein BJV82DRAFT_264895 [Fennellomyces sp. T-0311]|nr:hypothetical protein BJV82DRAFT_264895 [Fennellomyces sp. T-0311]
MCMKTAQAAVDACTKQQDLSASCACSAEKQVLSCYSECPPDDKMFGKFAGDIRHFRLQFLRQLLEMEEKKMAQIATLCNQPGAEGEAFNDENVKQQKLNGDEDQEEGNNDEDEGDESIFHAAALPEPIHVDEAVFGSTHAKNSQVVEQKTLSLASTTWIPLGSILLAHALILIISIQ